MNRDRKITRRPMLIAGLVIAVLAAFAAALMLGTHFLKRQLSAPALQLDTADLAKLPRVVPDSPSSTIEIVVSSAADGLSARFGESGLAARAPELDETIAKWRESLSQPGQPPADLAVVIRPASTDTRFEDLTRVYHSLIKAKFTRISFAGPTTQP